MTTVKIQHAYIILIKILSIEDGIFQLGCWGDDVYASHLFWETLKYEYYQQLYSHIIIYKVMYECK